MLVLVHIRGIHFLRTSCSNIQQFVVFHNMVCWIMPNLNYYLWYDSVFVYLFRIPVPCCIVIKCGDISLMYMVWWWATPLYCQFLIFLYIQYTVKLCDHSISCDALEVELNNFKLNSGPLWCLLTCHCDNKYGGFESINLLNCYNTFSRLQVF